MKGMRGLAVGCLGLLFPSYVGAADGTCVDGTPGVDGNNIVCCASGCSPCAGSGCSMNSLPLGGDDCCGTQIKESGVYCDDSGTAPCIIGSDPDGGGGPSCGSADARPPFRWNPDTGLNGRLYAEGAGCFTMTDLYQFQGYYNDGESKGPIYVLDATDDVDMFATSGTGKWLLTSDLFVEGGGTFYCRGTGLPGGDCDELRIESTSSKNFQEIRGYGGNLYFEQAVVTSWDTVEKEPQVVHTDGRSFVRCLSEIMDADDITCTEDNEATCTTCAIQNMGECRMDVIDTEMGYLGYDDAEAYGLTWKVRGYCGDREDLTFENPEVFEKVNVYGDIKGSDIHHNYFGMYSYGHQGGIWIGNKMHDNHQYGFDPHDDSDDLIIARNEVYNNVNHGIIASKRCNNVKIYHNTIRDGGEHGVGIFLHRSSDDSKVYGNVITNMQDAGIAVMESFGIEIYDNVVTGAQYGLRMSLGAANNDVHDNTFEDLSEIGLFTYFGADPPWVGDGRPYDNAFHNNEIINALSGVTIKDSDNISIVGNTFSGIEKIEFNDAQDTEFEGNSLPAGVCNKNHYGLSTFVGNPTLPGDCD